MNTAPSTSAALLQPWMRRLQAANCLRTEASRPDGYASLSWSKPSPPLRWLGLRVDAPRAAEDVPVDAVEFLLLLQKLLQVDETITEDKVLNWLSFQVNAESPASCAPSRRCFRDPHCIGGCLLPGANAQYRGTRELATDTLGVIVEVGEDGGAALLALLQRVRAEGEPSAERGLSDAFKTAYSSLATAMELPSRVIDLHIRMSSLHPSPESLIGVMATLTLWTISPPEGFRISGVDIAASSLLDFLSAAPVLPFSRLSVCASSSKASRYDPLAAPSLALNDATVRQLLAKSHGFVEELELCNVALVNFDSVVQGLTMGDKNRVRKLRLREFAMGIVSDGGIFGALREPSHSIYQTLEELEIRQAVHSAGGLSFWLEREAGAMLLKNDRLTRCIIHQACSMYPSTTHKGFSQTRGREIRLTLAPRCQLAFLSALPIKLPREVIVQILGMAERRAVRQAEMHYEPIEPDRLERFMRDWDAWKPKATRPQHATSLPYGSYYY